MLRWKRRWVIDRVLIHCHCAAQPHESFEYRSRAITRCTVIDELLLAKSTEAAHIIMWALSLMASASSEHLKITQSTMSPINVAISLSSHINNNANTLNTIQYVAVPGPPSAPTRGSIHRSHSIQAP
jgi:hypothetical protein